MKKKIIDYPKIKVHMIPGYDAVGQPNGISRVIENYLENGNRFGIDFVDDGTHDLTIAHAGMVGDKCDVSVLHGIYFTGDYPAPAFEYEVNRRIVESVRGAYAITVPSEWVSEILLRDMHVKPFVVPHGINVSEWSHKYKTQDYFLYNKNRDSVDVCDSIHVDKLASIARNVPFVSTFSKAKLPNIEVIGVTDHNVMKPIIQQAFGYLSLTKETFGIGLLEAMSSGVPILGWNFGGNVDLVKHGVNGYLAEPGNYNDLYNGIEYIRKHRAVLSRNSIAIAKEFTWEKSMIKLRSVLEYALEAKNEKPTVTVVVPAYNYGNRIKGCLDSIEKQTMKADQVIVVDDGSSYEESELTRLETQKHGFEYIKKDNGGVATARNLGAKRSKSKYICFIDADDQIGDMFLEKCVRALEDDRSLFIAYTKLTAVSKDGSRVVSQWPSEWNFDSQLKRLNQVPTCCVMRREVIERTGGYRQRFAPLGAGTEDADLWTRAGAMGMSARLVTQDPLFLYTVGSGNTSKSGYSEVDWLGWKGYMKTNHHPFASYAKPERQSHKVFQYDQPLVSVIIPVGPGHENGIIEAMDSVEGQTYKNWEVIVVSDTDQDIDLSPWPFAKTAKTQKPKSGPGVARNLGAKIARGKFLVFLDADDWLDITALDIMLTHYAINKGIVYPDYYGVSYIDPENIGSFENRLVSYDQRTKRAVMRHKSDNYDCQRAQRQPEYPLYHWCIVTCLIPKKWHTEIGGYDESMKSWEDVDYHWRMAQSGKCYSRIEQPLVWYNFSSGHRRSKADPETHSDVALSLIEYMKNKYIGKEMSPCRTCGNSSQIQVNWPESQQSGESLMSKNKDNEYTLCIYNHPNRGEHRVIGPQTGIDYGYRSGGEVFLVHLLDVKLMPTLFVEQNTLASDRQFIVDEELEDTSVSQVGEPVDISATKEKTVKKFDISVFPGITPAIGEKLLSSGIDSYEKLFALNEEYLKTIDGISDNRAKVIMKAISNYKEKA